MLLNFDSCFTEFQKYEFEFVRLEILVQKLMLHDNDSAWIVIETCMIRRAKR